MKWEVKLVGQADGRLVVYKKLGVVEADSFDEAWVKAENQFDIREEDHLYNDLVIQKYASLE